MGGQDGSLSDTRAMRRPALTWRVVLPGDGGQTEPLGKAQVRPSLLLFLFSPSSSGSSERIRLHTCDSMCDADVAYGAMLGAVRLTSRAANAASLCLCSTCAILTPRAVLPASSHCALSLRTSPTFPRYCPTHVLASWRILPQCYGLGGTETVYGAMMLRGPLVRR